MNASLSRREEEVVGLVCAGLRNREVAQRLCLSEYTIENHLRRIYAKLDVRNRTGLVARVFSGLAPVTGT